MKKAFTITELLVAMGLLAAVMMVSGEIFNYSLNAQRQAMATAEVMRTLRAITTQINIDFAGLCENAPIAAGFYKAAAGSEEVRADSIVFFSTGAFETINTPTQYGNIARIYYGQSINPAADSVEPSVRKIKVLARKQVILNITGAGDEGDPNTLLEQQRYFNSNPNTAAGEWLRRPDVDPNTSTGYPMYFAGGIDNFTVQIESGIDPNGTIIWWPKNSDIAAGSASKYTSAIKAIKFSFAIYDSMGIFKTGRNFEYIVYVKK